MSADTTEDTGTDTTTDELDKPLRDEGLRALKAERKNNKILADQLKELKDKWDAAEAEKLSKEEQATKRAEAAEAEVQRFKQERELDVLKADVAKAKGVPADLLAGTDQASLEAFADRIKEHMGPQKPEPNPFLGSESAGGDQDSDAKSILGFG